MAKKLDTSACSSTNGFPPKQGTWDFLQQAHQEVNAAIIQGMIGPSYSAAIPYAMYGFIASGGGIGPVTYSPGAIFFNGEVYLFSGQTIPGSFAFPNVPLLNIAISQYTTNADPVLFTDAVARNVHNIRTVVIGSGPSGTGSMADLHALVYMSQLPAFSSTGIVYGSVGGYTAANLGSPQYDVAYKINGNEVSLCGVVAVVMPAPGTFTLFTLPVGARPIKTVIIDPIITISNIVGQVTISTAGVISFSYSGSTASGNFYLDGITFRIN